METNSLITSVMIENQICSLTYNTKVPLSPDYGRLSRLSLTFPDQGKTYTFLHSTRQLAPCFRIFWRKMRSCLLNVKNVEFLDFVT